MNYKRVQELKLMEMKLLQKIQAQKYKRRKTLEQYQREVYSESFNNNHSQNNSMLALDEVSLMHNRMEQWNLKNEEKKKPKTESNTNMSSYARFVTSQGETTQGQGKRVLAPVKVAGKQPIGFAQNQKIQAVFPKKNTLNQDSE
mmetsp:Transcript_31098/g.30553  ORF Transcript_31098/g.30553 Transcript_31098/m.30553 type:complete len:144 (+) Transcript_31098:484-915(+)